MGCQTKVTLGKNLTFTVTTHDPDTGVLTDADSLPTYRIYKNEGTVPLLTGTMAKLDDSNTTGFYSEQITIVDGCGFEKRSSYSIYVVMVVGGDTGGTTFGFRVI